MISARCHLLHRRFAHCRNLLISRSALLIFHYNNNNKRIMMLPLIYLSTVFLATFTGGSRQCACHTPGGRTVHLRSLKRVRARAHDVQAAPGPETTATTAQAAAAAAAAHQNIDQTSTSKRFNVFHVDGGPREKGDRRVPNMRVAASRELHQCAQMLDRFLLKTDAYACQR